jgi:uncharacterized membrane protein YcaP (DUF421 family)
MKRSGDNLFQNRWISFIVYIAIAPIVILRMALRTGLHNVLIVLGLIVAGLVYIVSLVQSLSRRIKGWFY